MTIEPNNLYLGDCYELIKEIPDKSIDLILTDPPYSIKGLDSKAAKPTGIFKEKDSRYLKQLSSTNLGNGIDLKVLDEFVRVMKKINIYIWCNKEQIYEYLTYFVKNKKCNWEMIIWGKINPPPFLNGHYLKDKEYCLFFWEEGVKIHPSFETGKTIYISPTNVADKNLYNHPTIKDLGIIKNLILNSTGGGYIILDPFMGSGTTCVAAKELGRNYIGIEINKEYYDIAKDRLNGITQKERKQNIEQLKLF